MQEVVILKARSAQYENGEIKTNPIQNYSWYRKWRTDKDILRSHIYADNRKKLRDVFGKPSFCYRGEFYFHCWLLGLGGKAKLLILTAKEKGTCFEVVLEERGNKVVGDEDTIINFMDCLAHSLRRKECEIL